MTEMSVYLPYVDKVKSHPKTIFFTKEVLLSDSNEGVHWVYFPEIMLQNLPASSLCTHCFCSREDVLQIKDVR